MFLYYPSIRRKITLGYFLGIIAIIGLSIFTLVELWYIEKKIHFGEIVTEFFDATLEMRRFEKNFFLYKKIEDYNETILYLEKALDILNKNSKDYKNLTISVDVDKLKDNLNQYRLLMKQFSILRNTEDDKRLSLVENAIREKGKEIINFAENISKVERLRIQVMLNTIRKFIIISILSFSIIGIVVGQILSRMIVKPLKNIETMMDEISKGKLKKITNISKDREIISLTQAFNKMLYELDLRQKHLVQSEKLASLGTLISGVAHELNNPLSNISSSCQILIEEFDDIDDKFKKELLSQIDEQTDKAKNIVKSLLEFSRDKKFKREYLQLSKIIEETKQLLKGEIPTRITVNIDVPDEITVFADKQRIQQAFLNLIKNAIESIDNEGTVSIKAYKHILKSNIDELCDYTKEQGNCTGECPIKTDTINIEIRDTGNGISPDILPKIFDPFFTTKEVGKGVGLGLYIVQEIIHEHDGCIGVCSEIGKGTTFLIRFPVREQI